MHERPVCYKNEFEILRSQFGTSSWGGLRYAPMAFNRADFIQPRSYILDQKGNIVRKTWFEFLDNKQALDLAIKDLKDNNEIYIERFKKWLKK